VREPADSPDALAYTAARVTEARLTLQPIMDAWQTMDEPEHLVAAMGAVVLDWLATLPEADQESMLSAYLWALVHDWRHRQEAGDAED
jgi:hypothetical protein